LPYALLPPPRRRTSRPPVQQAGPHPPPTCAAGPPAEAQAPTPEPPHEGPGLQTRLAPPWQPEDAGNPQPVTAFRAIAEPDRRPRLFRRRRERRNPPFHFIPDTCLDPLHIPAATPRKWVRVGRKPDRHQHQRHQRRTPHSHCATVPLLERGFCPTVSLLEGIPPAPASGQPTAGF